MPLTSPAAAAALGAVVVGLLLVLAGPAAPAAQAARASCDPLDRAHCLLPWPNDHFRKGGRLALRDDMMPRNAQGRPVSAADYNRSDGFSPGQFIVTRVPGLDLERSGAVPVNNMARTFAKRAPIVVIDAKTGKRQLIWAELDAQATNPRKRALLVHPGANWREGRRYIVALRNLKNSRGTELQARGLFRRLRDGEARGQRAKRFEGIFRRLGKAGIRRRDLYLAWDFTVASRRSLSQRLLSIRDRAFAELGDTSLGDLQVQGSAPAFTVDSVTQETADVKRVDGTFTIPCFLDRAGCPPGARFRLGRDGLP